VAVTACTRSALLAVLASCGLAPAAVPQPALPAAPTSADVRARAEVLADEAARSASCDLAIHGEPLLESDGKWLVAYSASGDACDKAADALRARGSALDILFFRRPNQDEALELANRIRTTVGTAYGCRISIRGDPEIDETTAWWAVSYVAMGINCADATGELSRQGREAMILFMPAPGRGDAAPPTPFTR
jgi:hypothetical protein